MLNKIRVIWGNPHYRMRVVVYSAVLLMTFCQLFSAQLTYQPDLIFVEPWRLWTMHWVHLGFWHWVLNVFGLILLPEIFLYASVRIFILLWLTLPVLISLLFYVFLPTLTFYAGLSGVLHGIYLVLALVAIQSNVKAERAAGWVVILGLCIKVGWEAYSGNSQTAELIGAPVILQAHQYGAGVGLLWWLLLRSLQRKTDQKL